MALGVDPVFCPVHMSVWRRRLSKSYRSREGLNFITATNSISACIGTYQFMSIAKVSREILTPAVRGFLSTVVNRHGKAFYERPPYSSHVIQGWWRWAFQKFCQINGIKNASMHAMVGEDTRRMLNAHVQVNYVLDPPAINVKFWATNYGSIEVIQKRWFFYGHRLVLAVHHSRSGESRLTCLNHKGRLRFYWHRTKTLPTILGLHPTARVRKERKHDPHGS
jgi:hypothetical protein